MLYEFVLIKKVNTLALFLYSGLSAEVKLLTIVQLYIMLFLITNILWKDYETSKRDKLSFMVHRRPTKKYYLSISTFPNCSRNLKRKLERG